MAADDRNEGAIAAIAAVGTCCHWADCTSRTTATARSKGQQVLGCNIAPSLNGDGACGGTISGSRTGDGDSAQTRSVDVSAEQHPRISGLSSRTENRSARHYVSGGIEYYRTNAIGARLCRHYSDSAASACCPATSDDAAQLDCIGRRRRSVRSDYSYTPTLACSERRTSGDGRCLIEQNLPTGEPIGLRYQ